MRLSPTRRALLAWCACLGLGVLAVLWPPLTPAAWAVVGALALGLAVDAWGLAQRPALIVRRVLPDRATCGRDAELVLHLMNASELSVSVEVQEALPGDLGAREGPFELRLPARGSVEHAVPIHPRVRGDRRLGTVTALEGGVLGLVRRRSEGEPGQVLRVYPDTRAFLSRDALDPKRLRATLGIRPARRRGDGSEFDSLREYGPGDDPRRLDWAASARRGRPVVREYRHERNHTVWIALDASRLMAGRDGADRRSKLDAAVDAALALAHAAVASGDRVGLTVFDRAVRAHLAPRRARRDLGEFIELLTDVHPAIVEADFGALARELAVRQRARALVVVLTDFAETETATFLGPLAVLARQHRVLLVAVRDRIFEALDTRHPAGHPARGAHEEAHEAYRRIVVDDLLTERETALLGLRRRGLQTLDLPPAAITAGVLNRYLEMREGR